MKSKKLVYLLIPIAFCIYLTLICFIFKFLNSTTDIVFLPVGEECFYPQTLIDDEFVIETRPILYINPTPTSEKPDSDFLLSLLLTDTRVKAKAAGIKHVEMTHYKDEKLRSRHYIFITY